MSKDERSDVRKLRKIIGKVYPDTVPRAKSKVVARKLDYNDCASVEAVRKKPRVVLDEDVSVYKKVEVVRRLPIVTRSIKHHISPAISANICFNIDDKACEG